MLRVLASPPFVKAPPLSRFLQYVCAQVFNGHGSHINEQLIGIEVFGRTPGYDSNDDNIVRASASRLRSRLDVYFAGEGVQENWTISIPRGSYVPQFTPRVENGSSLPSLRSLPHHSHQQASNGSDTALDPGSLAPINAEATAPAIPSVRDPKLHALTLRLVVGGLCAAIVVALCFGWRGSEEARRHFTSAAPSHAADKQAVELYLEGQYLCAKHLPEPIHESILRFQQAIRLDPNYALPYAGLADAYAITASELPAPERGQEAKSYAEHALALDPSSSEAHAAFAFILYKFEWNWPEAESQFRDAIQLNPKYALAHHWFGEFLVLLRQPEEGLGQLRQALA